MAERAIPERPASEEAPFSIQQVIHDALQRTAGVHVGVRTLEAVLGILGAVGIIALILNAAVNGFDDLKPWGYTAVVAFFLLSSFMAAPILAILLRLTRADWRRPLSRLAEIQSVAGIVMLIYFIPLIIVVPTNEGRATWYTNWPWGAPWLFDLILLMLLVFSSIGLLWISSMPDFAVAKGHTEQGSSKHRWYTKLAVDWVGSNKQWIVQRAGIGVVGGLYVILYVWTVSIVFADYTTALLPSWNSAVLPAFGVISSLETGLATSILIMYILKRWGGMEEYITWDYFWAISKLLLTTSMLWFWLYFSELIIFWYGRLPGQINVLKAVMWDTYFWPMIFTLLLNFIIPLFVLISNHARKNYKIVTGIALLVTIGTLIDRYRLFGASFSSKNPFAHELTENLMPKEMLAPGIFDVLIVVGGLSGAIFMILIASRFIPVLSIWEFGSGIGLRIRRRYGHHDVPVIGKPE